MPWKECSVVEERLRFVARLLDGEAMTELCREFGLGAQGCRRWSVSQVRFRMYFGPPVLVVSR
jgi:transposase-like protein